MAKSHNNTGRSPKKQRFVGIPHCIVLSDSIAAKAYQQLSSNARSAVIQILARFNGSNNGYLAASSRDLATEMNVSKTVAVRAVNELVKKGFFRNYGTINIQSKDKNSTVLSCVLGAMQQK